ncbi:efflux transporter outer membrane subunit [Acetobacteraceae bacterium KSS8]|uniref:Efflux transporter outer membrane subunit n=1 Tax=Endosaccharibacter trunci TaxID=2812733 RepID=A0ABT1W2C3_9PROT|nr:efflux transporter outer membrane subunit [Acetobacteraceae bacterium KSS8]
MSMFRRVVPHGFRAGRLSALLLAGTCAACMVGPDYHKPDAILSARFKEIPPPPGWAFADPHYAELPKGHWWEIYNDPQLNRLEERVNISNQTIKADEAAFRQARALVDEARSSLFPSASLTPSITRSGAGQGTSTLASSIPTTGATTVGNRSLGESDITRYELSGTLDWEPDIWGRIRRQVESNVSGAQASQATLDAARLSEQTSLATYYFEMLYQDSLIALLKQFVSYYEQNAAINRNQVAAGTTDPSDLLQAETQVASTKAQLVSAGILRAQYEHAIAVLIGEPPAALTIAPGALPTTIPAIPVTIPSLLLQRRPDIAEQERIMEEENALIGVAIAAYYPTISLSATADYAGDPIGSLFKLANRSWSIAASAAETLFEGGLRTADVRAARATFDQAVANYRQTVLTAMQGVEDQLSNLRILAEQADAQARAVDLANQAVVVSLNQYRAGTAIYTTVITNQETALSNAETALGVQESRMVDSVQLITALGGGWSTSDLISKTALQTDNPLLPSFISPDKN